MVDFPPGAVVATFLDRSPWGSGPWDNEPDRVFWRERDLPCLVRRAPHGAWCGYVAVGTGHIWHGRHFSRVDAQVHGGLSFSAHWAGDEETGVRHKPEPGEPDLVWWLGFDCMRFGDLLPLVAGIPELASLLSLTEYRTMDYAIANVRSLAEQAQRVRP
jgi:hypothetical protein